MAFILLGNLYYELGKYDLANEQYQAAVKLNYTDAVAHVSLGNTYYMQDNVEKALVSYREAIRTAPENDEYKLVYLQVLDEYIDKKES